MKKRPLSVALGICLVVGATAGCGAGEEAPYLAKETVHSQDNKVTEYEYDAAANLVKEIYYYNDEEAMRTEYEYDESGNLIKERVYDSGPDYPGTLTLSVEREYDMAGNEVKWIGYYYSLWGIMEDAKIGDIAFWFEYTYDEAGNQTSSIRYGENGEVEYYKEYAYDEDGDRISITTFDGNGNIISQEITLEKEYDDAGLLIKSTNYEYGRVVSWIEYEYK